uniref:Uncharacterized protein n=1 Tax=Pseudo-nitzschia australis TaxID=44445 RepID=A0A7S4AXB2_9STRA|mmetsp:Transcript_135/g.341  ORF Transcript_135/g.341 Transcript_135/m.341 type:complete len:222 (+) Transcript_135:121-786(+)
MTKMKIKLISKLNVFSRKREFQPVPADGEEYTEDFRTRGCEILKAISDETQTSNTSTMASQEDNDNRYGGRSRRRSSIGSNNNSIELDWHESIQRFQKQQQMPNPNKTKGENKDSHGRREKVQRLKLLKRALERRRKLDSKGSFAINMVTYRDENKTSGRELRDTPAAAVGKNHDSNSGDNLGCDDRSDSVTTYMSNDFTLRVIDEEVQYCNYNDATYKTI